MTETELTANRVIDQTFPLKSLYAKMLRIRRVEEMIGDRYTDQRMRCPTHLSIGQEYAPVCLSEFLTPHDQAVSTHRPHAHYLSMGGNLRKMIAELYGKRSGCSGGRGGSMHLIDEQIGFKGSTAIVGNSIPLGVGLAWAKKIKQQPGIVIIFLGDAAIEEGVFYESVNFALIHKLPIIFFCENNLYSVYASLNVRQPYQRNIVQLTQGLGLDSYTCDGYDLPATYSCLQTCVQNTRRYSIPQFIEIQTYRYRDHCGVDEDYHLGYRSKDEVEHWKQRDPLLQLKAKIDNIEETSLWAKEQELLIENEIKIVFRSVEKETTASNAMPNINNFQAPSTKPLDTVDESDNKILTFSEAINEGLLQLMEIRPDIICYGLGINDPKRIFGTTNQLLETFGPNRVYDMPTAENGMLGIGIGAALNGLTPVMIHQRLDFFLLAMDQLVNNAAKWFFTFGGKRSVPICIRLIVGRGWGQGPTHSQILASWFAHIPGLKVVMPSTARDAKGLLIASIIDPNPVIFIEHRWCHGLKSRVPDANTFSIPLGKANRIQSGEALTLISASYPIIECIEACKRLADTCPNSIELIDLRSIAPMDWDSILTSVGKTKRLLVVDPGWAPMGLGHEIIAHCTQHLEIEWKARPKCLSLPHHSIPTGFEQTQNLYPTAQVICEAVTSLLGIENSTLECLHQTSNDTQLHDVPNPEFTGPF